MHKKIVPEHQYRKVIADLRTCEERYQRLVDSIPATDETRLKAALATLQSEVRQRKRLEAELLTSVETERERIGQDLHDDLCQQLGATAMMTSVIAARVGHKDSALGQQLLEIAKLINNTIESCRLLARGLHPITLAAKGLPAAAADAAAQRMIGEPERAIDTLAREELGFDPEELGGSAWVAAATSFVLFAIGAIVPVAPFAIWSGHLAIVVSVGASAVALFGIGAAITLLTGRGVLFSGTRQLLIGLGAAALTWAIGRWIGVSLAG